MKTNRDKFHKWLRDKPQPRCPEHTFMMVDLDRDGWVDIYEFFPVETGGLGGWMQEVNYRNIPAGTDIKVTDWEFPDDLP